VRDFLIRTIRVIGVVRIISEQRSAI
jgi:hypothetical protein